MFSRHPNLILAAISLPLIPLLGSEGGSGSSAAQEEYALPVWSVSTTTSASAGYRDNILLSPENPDGSLFLRGELDAMFLRLPERNWDGYIYLNLAETRYFSAEQTDHERTGFVTSELRWQSSDRLKLGVTGQGYHHDQVFDVSVDQALLDTAKMKVTGATLAPFVRWEFHPGWWTEVRGTGRKDHFADNIDGYTEGEGSLLMGHDWASGSALSLGAASRWRSHDSRVQFTAAGRPLTGALLKSQQEELSLKYTLIPHLKSKWRTSLSASQMKSRDNGSGYFDFTRKQVVASVNWKPVNWDVSLSTTYADYDFPVQLVGIGINPENRHKKETRFNLEATRRLTPTWSVIGGYEYERSTSNDDRSRFRINTAYVGFQWEWDNLGSD